MPVISKFKNITKVRANNKNIGSIYVGDNLVWKLKSAETIEPTRYIKFSCTESGVIGIPHESDYDTIRSQSPFISYHNYDPDTEYIKIYYSLDNVNWEKWDYSDIPVSAGSSVYFAGDCKYGLSPYSSIILGDDPNSSDLGPGNFPCFKFWTPSGKFNLSGDISAICSFSEENDSKIEWFSFHDLFSHCNIVSVAEDFLSGIHDVSGYYGFCATFAHCNYLTGVPRFPENYTLSEKLDEGLRKQLAGQNFIGHAVALLYQGTFVGCASLEYLPENYIIPHLTEGSIGTGSFHTGTGHTMFGGCERLKNLPVLFPDTSQTQTSDGCFYYMFWDCTSLVDASGIDISITGQYSCYDMFYECTSLKYPPKLSATTLQDGCYYLMFRKCTSLVVGPELPAVTSASYCYAGMFLECSNLSYVDCKLQSANESSDTMYWLDGVAGVGELYSPNYSGWTLNNPSGCPTGWSNAVSEETSEWLRFDSAATRDGNKITLKLTGTHTLDVIIFSNSIPFSGYSITHTTEFDFPAGESFFIRGDDGSGKYTAVDNDNYFSIISGDFTDCYGNLSAMSGNPGQTNLLASTSHYGFAHLFDGFTFLRRAPKMPATWLSPYCYSYLFKGCTYLEAPEILPATHLADYCYSFMFHYCSHFTDRVPELPATVLTNSCYNYMFCSCQNLTVVPDLTHITQFANLSCHAMFQSAAITDVPKFLPTNPETQLGPACFRGMFWYCKSLRTVDLGLLPYTELAVNCYNTMFCGCSALTQAPDLPATTLQTYCYQGMFQYCSSLDKVYCNAPELGTTYSKDWLDSVAPTGTLYLLPGATCPTDSPDGCPTGWNTEKRERWVEFCDLQGEGIILFQYVGNPEFNDYRLDLQYSYDKITWTQAELDADHNYLIQISESTSSVYVRGKNVTGLGDGQGHEHYQILVLKSFPYYYGSPDDLIYRYSLSGNIMAFIDYETLPNSIDYVFAFWEAFKSDSGFGIPSGLTHVSKEFLPATKVRSECYYEMFKNCQFLEDAPELPATELADGCYYAMFSGCTSLEEAPELPATEINFGCYSEMFSGCTSLRVAPELPATELAMGCYNGMFDGCTSLTKAPELPATELTEYCYLNMFYGCTSLNEVHCDASKLRTTYSYNWLYSVAPTGTLYLSADNTECLIDDPSGCPTGWTIVKESAAPSGKAYVKFYDFSGSGYFYFYPLRMGEGEFKELNIEYSYDNITWNRPETEESTEDDIPPAPFIPITQGQALYLRGKNPEGFNNLDADANGAVWFPILFDEDYSPTIQSYSVDGNIMSLIDYETLPDTVPGSAFAAFFSGPFMIEQSLLGQNINQIINISDNFLPATTVGTFGYVSMFLGQIHLQKAPILPATELTEECYTQMFYSCTSLNEVYCDASVLGFHYSGMWLNYVAPTGTLHLLPSNIECPIDDPSGCPTGWTLVREIRTTPSLEFCDITESGTLFITGPVKYNLEYSKDQENWTSISGGSWRSDNGGYVAEINVIPGESIYLRGINETLASGTNRWNTTTIKMFLKNSGGSQISYSLNGTIRALLNYTDLPDKIPDYCFRDTFAESDIRYIGDGVLGAQEFGDNCYEGCFADTGLISIGEMEVSKVGINSCGSMFSGCTSLERCPELPATELADGCYSMMFWRCSELTDIPSELPAMTLASECYVGMFYGCTSIGKAPILPATELADYCYNSMFSGCTSLNEVYCDASVLGATYSESWLTSVAPTGTLHLLPSNTECPIDDSSGCPTGWTIVKQERPLHYIEFYNFSAPGQIQLGQQGEKASFNLEFSLNGSSWKPLMVTYYDDSDTEETQEEKLKNGVQFNTGDSIRIRGINPNGLSKLSSHDIYRINGFGVYNSNLQGTYSLRGNIMSLIDYRTLPNKIDDSEGGFAGLFNTGDEFFKISEISYNFLPSTELNPGEYMGLFIGQSLITKAPELPSLTAFSYTYNQMFYGCTSLNEVHCNALVLGGLIDGGGLVSDSWLASVAPTGTLYLSAANKVCPLNSTSGCPTGWTIVRVMEPLTFTALSASTLGLDNSKRTSANPVLYISKDKTTWTEWDYSTVSIPSGTSVYIKGNDSGKAFNKSGTNYSRFTGSGSLKVSGCLMSLVEEAGENLLSTTESYTFSNLFYQFTALVDIYGLVFPENTNSSCYRNMFKECTSLITPPPILLATALTANCYTSMFQGCTSLREAPALLATTLTGGCYTAMFSGCTSLEVAPELSATTLAESCYSQMFYNCASLRVAPELPATNLQSSCYNGMFFHCTSLEEAPVLPATTLATFCYYSMFYGCTSLEVAPELPAATLVGNCYDYMFWGCSRLSEVTALFSTWKSGCTNFWLQNVAESGIFTRLDTADNIPTSTSGIPTGWVVNVESSIVYPDDALYFTGKAASNSIYLEKHGSSNPSLSYSRNGKDWTSWTGTGDGTTLTIGQDEVLFLKGSNSSGFSTSTSNYTTIKVEGQVECTGNLMHLLSSSPSSTIPCTYCFYRIFYGSSGLTVAPRIPAITLKTYCYGEAFCGTSITKSPVIPDVTLASNCFYQMFYDCTKLKEITLLCTSNPFASSGLVTKTYTYTSKWCQNVPTTSGYVFNRNSSASWSTSTRGVNTIPTNWTIKGVNPSDYPA